MRAPTRRLPEPERRLPCRAGRALPARSRAFGASRGRTKAGNERSATVPPRPESAGASEPRAPEATSAATTPLPPTTARAAIASLEAREHAAPRPRRRWRRPALADVLGTLALLVLAFVAAIGPESVLVALGAPPALVYSLERGVLFRGRVVHVRELLSIARRFGTPPPIAVEYAFLGQVLATIASYAVLFALALAWLRARGVAIGELFRLSRAGAWVTLRVALVVAGAALVLGAIGAVVEARLEGGDGVRLLLDELDLALLHAPGGALATTALMVVVAPLAEETVFRGILYRTLRAGMPPGFAAVLQATVFAAYHVGAWPVALLPVQYGFGLLAAYLVERTGSLASAVLLHALGNACGLVLVAFAVGDPERVLALFRT